MWFCQQYPQAYEPVMKWYKLARVTHAQNHDELNTTMANTVDVVGKLTIFDVGGNKYRVVTKIEYRFQQMYIVAVQTHKQYDQTDWRKLCR